MRKRPKRIYLYRQTTDYSFAPCVYGGRLLSFATCKPDIRRNAEIGNLVIGISGKAINGGRLIHVFRVTAVEKNGDYYRDPKYRGRPDCIYQDDLNGRPMHRGLSPHHCQPDAWLGFWNGLETTKDKEHFAKDLKIYHLRTLSGITLIWKDPMKKLNRTSVRFIKDEAATSLN